MDIIPVIDLLQGQVVHAKRGERHLYRPIESRLCKGSDPIKIVRALLELYPFDSLYIADLDAILGRGNHLSTIAALQSHYPHLDIWLDAGLNDPLQILAWAQLDLDMVIGSESLSTMEQYLDLINAMVSTSPLLSLDYGKEGFIGSPQILAQVSHWPARVIAMSLSLVGSREGPDITLMEELVVRSGHRQLIAAGGIRDIEDIHRLEQIGVTGVLIGSALHDGRIDGQNIPQ